MSKNLQNAIACLGRLLFVVLFLPAGVGKVIDFSGTVGYVASAGLPCRPWARWPPCWSKSSAAWPCCWAWAPAMPLR
jgi:uncharacterized membrane protein YphA (DoxX/SURF4 family)